jgi:hypothetical protein
MERADLRKPKLENRKPSTDNIALEFAAAPPKTLEGCRTLNWLISTSSGAGIFLFLDMEKAFDRVSYEFTKKGWTHTGSARDSKNGWG